MSLKDSQDKRRIAFDARKFTIHGAKLFGALNIKQNWGLLQKAKQQFGDSREIVCEELNSWETVGKRSGHNEIEQINSTVWGTARLWRDSTRQQRT